MLGQPDWFKLDMVGLTGGSAWPVLYPLDSTAISVTTVTSRQPQLFGLAGLATLHTIGAEHAMTRLRFDWGQGQPKRPRPEPRNPAVPVQCHLLPTAHGLPHAVQQLFHFEHF